MRGKDLEDVLTHETNRDVDGYMLTEEMHTLISIFSEYTQGDIQKMFNFLSVKSRSSFRFLKFLDRLQNCPDYTSNGGFW